MGVVHSGNHNILTRGNREELSRSNKCLNVRSRKVLTVNLTQAMTHSGGSSTTGLTLYSEPPHALKNSSAAAKIKATLQGIMDINLA